MLNIISKIKCFLTKRLGLSLNSVPNAQGLLITSPIEHNSQEKIDEFYSNPNFVSSYLDSNRLNFYKQTVYFFKNMTNLEYSNKQIADVGCGTGHLLMSIRELNFDVFLTGFEYSKAALKLAKKNLPEANFFYYDIYDKLDYKFDIVFCTEVLEHLLYPHIALQNIIHLSQDSGVIMITVPNGRIDTFEGHINFWSPESWKVFIESNISDQEFEVKVGLIDNLTNFAILKRI